LYKDAIFQVVAMDLLRGNIYRLKLRYKDSFLQSTESLKWCEYYFYLLMFRLAADPRIRRKPQMLRRKNKEATRLPSDPHPPNSEN
jgi:hypothetical protein